MSISLRDLAAKWRVSEEPAFISRHEYDSLKDPSSPTGDTIEVGPVGPVGPPKDINDLDAESRTHLSGSNGGSTPRSLPALPDVPAEWTAGVYKLQTMSAPDDIEDRRWAHFRYDSLRLLHEHGAALYASGWDEVDVFGLHRLAPGRRPDGMGLAWLIKNAAVVAIAGSTVAIKADDGVLQRVFRRGGHATLVSVAAWDMDRDQK